MMANNVVYASSYKNSENDWGEAINAAINTITNGQVILPPGELVCTKPILQKSKISIIGQGIDVTVLRPIGCHGITVVEDQYLDFARIADLSIMGYNNGDYTIYSPTNHGINWDTGNREALRCSIENVRIINCYGKGLYAPYDFSNNYRQVYVSHCGGNAIEINGLNTCTLENCYVDYVADGKVGYRIYHGATLISCNGMGGNGDYWGVFGRKNGLYEDADNGVLQHYITFINCNIEDFKKIGCLFLFAGGFNFISTQFYAPENGSFEYYISADNLTLMSELDGLTGFESKGATGQFASDIRSGVSNPQLLVYNNQPDFTVDGTTVYGIPKISSVYASYLQGALELEYANIKGMSYYYHGGKKHIVGTASPTAGNWAKGDTVHNSDPTGGEYAGWICTEAGTPGIWKGFGLIEI